MLTRPFIFMLGLACSCCSGADELGLELPQLGSTLYREGVIVLPGTLDPRDITNLRIHIPGIDKARVYTKVNTLGVGMIQTLLSRQDGLVSNLDLTMHAGKYAFGTGTNIIEVKVTESNNEPRYARWAIVSDKRDSGKPLVERSVVGVMKNVAIVPLKLEVNVGGSKQELKSRTTIAAEVTVSGSIMGAPPNSFVVLSSDAPGGPSRRGIGVVDERSPVRLASKFAHSIPLVAGPNDLRLTVYAENQPQVVYDISLIHRPVAPLEAFPGGKWAVVIGISDYLHSDRGIVDLSYAARDAKAFSKFLLSHEGGGFLPNQIRVLTDQQATAKNIRTALFNFLAKSGREDLVVVFFAGHGSPDPVNPDNHYLLAHDTVPDNMGGTAIAMWDLKNLLDYTIKASRAVVFADACHSGNAVNFSGFNSKLNFVNKYLENLAAGSGRMVVTASRADEFSFEDARWGGGHGVFTHSLLEGLSGDADTNSDGVVNVGEVLDYLETKVPSETDGQQHISYRRIDINPGLPLSRLE